MSDLSRVLDSFGALGDGDIFLAVKGKADFTNGKAATLIVRSESVRVEVPLPLDKTRLRVMIGQLRIHLSGNRKIIAWGIKDLFSYVLGRLKVPLRLDARIYDLKIIEWYYGLELDMPETLKEAQVRLAEAAGHSSWVHLKNLLARIYNPLITQVIPEIETLGVVNTTINKCVHSHYEIAGQVNGRMGCNNEFSLSFNPHTSSQEERAALRPPLFDHLFMNLDYKYMEVTTLQWLSGDPVLAKIIETGEDVYNAIWRELLGIEPTPAYRKMCKSVFLPVAYGLGAETLAERIKVPVEFATKLRERIYEKFCVAMNWLKSQQNTADKDGWYYDVLGRGRQFEENKYKIRNIAVQSPASILCLEKLVKLYNDLKGKARIGFHIHDGYMVFVPKTDVRSVKELAVASLESESELFTGLKLRVSCEVGEDWSHLS